MGYQYLFHELAQQDYEASLEWYLNKSTQAANNFVLAIDHALKLICDHPDQWRNQYKNFHEILLKKYPFSIIYVIEESRKLVIITAVFHHKKSPQSKYRKI